MLMTSCVGYVPQEPSSPGEKVPVCSGAKDLAAGGEKFSDLWDFLEIISVTVKARRKKEVMATRKRQEWKGISGNKKRTKYTCAFVNYMSRWSNT